LAGLPRNLIRKLKRMIASGKFSSSLMCLKTKSAAQGWYTDAEIKEKLLEARKTLEAASEEIGGLTASVEIAV
jgi:hypothetical protein